MEDFIVETKGLCFICLNKLVPRHLASEETSSVNSLQYLSRYVNVDMGKVFDEEGPVPPDLVAKVKSARLMVELCERCVLINESFSKLYRQLERIEMEMATHVDLIHKNMMEANENALPMHFPESKDDITDGGDNFNGKLRILKALRKETKEKCDEKGKKFTFIPRIKLKRWSMKQVNARRRKITASVFSRAQKTTTDERATMEGGVKDESNCSSDNMESDDTGNDNFDDHDQQRDDSVRPPSPPDSSEVPTLANTETEYEQESVFEQHSTGSMTVRNYILDVGNYQCKLCPKQFKSQGSWRNHYNSVHQNIKYKCKLCGAEFGRPDNYKTHHQSVHLGVKFKCLVCNKTFTQKGNLSSHQKTGTCKTFNRCK